MTGGTGDEPAIQPDHPSRARELVGWLLSGNQEARSLLSDASHRRVLAEQSAAAAAEAAGAADVARLRYEALRHRLDPRGERPVHFGTALMLVAAIGAGLAGLAWIEMAGLPAGRMLVAVAAAAVWVAGAWLAAIASRERRSMLAGSIGAAAVTLAAALAVLHAAGALPGRPDGWGRTAVGVLCAVLSFALAVTAAVLITRAEPAAIAEARGRWRRVRAHHDATVGTRLADAEAAAIARESWLSLVRAVGASAGEGDEQLTQDAIMVAADLI